MESRGEVPWEAPKGMNGIILFEGMSDESGKRMGMKKTWGSIPGRPDVSKKPGTDDHSVAGEVTKPQGVSDMTLKLTSKTAT